MLTKTSVADPDSPLTAATSERRDFRPPQESDLDITVDFDPNPEAGAAATAEQGEQLPGMQTSGEEGGEAKAGEVGSAVDLKPGDQAEAADPVDLGALLFGLPAGAEAGATPTTDQGAQPLLGSLTGSEAGGEAKVGEAEGLLDSGIGDGEGLDESTGGVEIPLEWDARETEQEQETAGALDALHDAKPADQEPAAGDELLAAREIETAQERAGEAVASAVGSVPDLGTSDEEEAGAPAEEIEIAVEWDSGEEESEAAAADEAGISQEVPAAAEQGEVAASVFERYRTATYHEAEHKPYVMAAMILLNRFEHPDRVLFKLLSQNRLRHHLD